MHVAAIRVSTQTRGRVRRCMILSLLHVAVLRYLHLVKNVKFSFSFCLMYNSRLFQQVSVDCSTNDLLVPKEKFTV